MARTYADAECNTETDARPRAGWASFTWRDGDVKAGLARWIVGRPRGLAYFQTTAGELLVASDSLAVQRKKTPLYLGFRVLRAAAVCCH